jgi:hypothetical protein
MSVECEEWSVELVEEQSSSPKYILSNTVQNAEDMLFQMAYPLLL